MALVDDDQVEEVRRIVGEESRLVARSGHGLVAGEVDLTASVDPAPDPFHRLRAEG